VITFSPILEPIGKAAFMTGQSIWRLLGTRYCQTKADLILSYNEAVNVYSNLATKAKADIHKSLSSEQYEELSVVGEEWRVRVETERDALQEHCKMHGC
jgi:hypothetical protein